MKVAGVIFSLVVMFVVFGAGWQVSEGVSRGKVPDLCRNVCYGSGGCTPSNDDCQQCTNGPIVKCSYYCFIGDCE